MTGYRTPPLKLDATEQAAVMDELMSPRFVDCAPHQVYACLLDEGRYLVDVLQRVGIHPASRVDELTPRLWKQHFAVNPLRSDVERFNNAPV